MVNFDVTADVGHPPFDTQLLLAIQDIDKVLPLGLCSGPLLFAALADAAE